MERAGDLFFENDAANPRWEILTNKLRDISQRGFAASFSQNKSPALSITQRNWF
jgi:hypothetical protein